MWLEADAACLETTQIDKAGRTAQDLRRCATSGRVSLSVLAIDTATAQCGAALLCADGRYSVQRRRVTAHSESLLQLVQLCLDACELSLGQVQGIACSAGPGSFTGLRIGMATAKGLCFALGVPLCAVSSLESFARASGGPEPELPTLVVLDAFRGQLFARLVSPRSEGPSAASSRQLLLTLPQLGVDAMWHPADLARAVLPIAGAFRLCCVEPIPDQAQPLAAMALALSIDRGESQSAATRDVLLEPPPLALARLSAERLGLGQHADLFDVAPNYLCGSAPEEAERQRLLASHTA